MIRKTGQPIYIQYANNQSKNKRDPKIDIILKNCLNLNKKQIMLVEYLRIN